MSIDCPDISWLAESIAPDDDWPGPGPALPNLRSWINQVARSSHHSLVFLSSHAARCALPHWQSWHNVSPDLAIESISESQPPPDQLALVSDWLSDPSDSRIHFAHESVDHTKQLHWFHDDYADTWFNYPGMWAAESSEFCVLTLTGDRYSGCSFSELALISVACAINSFRRSESDGAKDAIRLIAGTLQNQNDG